MTKRPAKTADTRPPIAISFLRYSDPARQRKGDSTRRQTADSEAWCLRAGIPLDKSLHHGGSAFHGRHRDDKTVLGQFLQDAQAGLVPRSSFLIIENLDRLSREEERTALRLWMDILDAGVNIVQLHPETIFRHDKSDMVDIMRAIIELSRGHSESRMKSVRSLANWDRAIERARSEGRPMTRRLPSWIELDEDGRPQLIEDRAAVIRQIFDWARMGYGFQVIVKKLIDGKVPAFGDRVLEHDEDGTPYYRQADGQRFGCGEWRTAYCRSILRDRRVLGELEVRDRSGNKKGETLVGYYPSVVSEDLFNVVRNAIKTRTGRQGRIGEGVASLFSGLLKNARDETGTDTYYVSTYMENGQAAKRLLNKSAIEKTSRAYTFVYPIFERALLACLREILPSEVTGRVPPANAEALQKELKKIKEKRAALAAVMLDDIEDLPEITTQLRDLAGRQSETEAKLETAQEHAVQSPADTWKDVGTLTDLLDKAPEEEKTDLRLRLRSVLRRSIESVWLLIVPRGRVRLLWAQVVFAEGGLRRDYLVLHRPALANAASRTPGGWWAKSADFLKANELDLRQQADALTLERILSEYDLDELRARLEQGEDK